jgi:hypothetical protein
MEAMTTIRVTVAANELRITAAELLHRLDDTNSPPIKGPDGRPHITAAQLDQLRGQLAR